MLTIAGLGLILLSLLNGYTHHILPRPVLLKIRNNEVTK